MTIPQSDEFRDEVGACYPQEALRRTFRFLTLLGMLLLLSFSMDVTAARAAGPVGGSAEARMAAIAKAVPTAVLVFEPGGNGGGSGVLISPEGEALTNFHVTSPAGSFMRCGLADGKIYDAVIVGIDPVGDLAMIRLLGDKPFPYAKLADSDQVRVGDACFAAGNPFLLANNLEPSVSWGIVSGTHRYQFPSGTLLEYGDCLQTDAAINPGNSGGALFDANSDVIGIIGRCSFEKRGRVNVGIGYAISSNQAKNFVGVLRSGRIVDHATLGATVTDSGERRVRISNILESSDAYRRGLRYGDELISIDGREVTSADEFTNIMATLPEGWRVPLVFRRDGRNVETIVRLPGVHSPGELVKKMAGALPPADEPPKKKKPAKDRGKPPADEAENEEPSNTADDRFDPKIVAMFERKPELANEFFNRQARERIAKSVTDLRPSQVARDSVWKISGRVGEQGIAGNQSVGTPFTAIVQTDAAKLVIGDSLENESSLGELYNAINQRAVGGLQAALIQWYRLARFGKENSGEMLYFGTAPLLGQRPLRDCLIVTQGELESRFFTSPVNGQVELIEVSADRDQDPAELHLFWDAKEPSKLTSMKLVYGTDVISTITVESVTAVEQGKL